MKLGELIDLRKVKQVHKSTVAAGKAPRLELATVGISIGQEQSTGDTSRVNEAKLGERMPYDSYNAWKRDLPKKATLKHDVEQTVSPGKKIEDSPMRSIERAQAFGKDFQGLAGQFNHDTGKGWIYEYYLKKENLLEASVSAIFKKYMKPTGSIASVFKGDAEAAAELLRARTSDQLYVLNTDSPDAKAAFKAVKPHDRRNGGDDEMSVAKLIGKRLVLVRGDKAYMAKFEYETLVEEFN